ncbi:DUF5789 family protein [Natranaeroarchaeum aerophilus]|uniref:DUF5789 family protein n=1 Tax=Natranaeroarchaeum aerophilus TaxID=2917711 RepID=A0AAE3FT06_9EURY|nr:DUF5789 family protein [Natranaeroarchaeum aerophilus]MCL9814793.1 DUF5789 family protein [Natranaeroarchaeum aerophilus]
MSDDDAEAEEPAVELGDGTPVEGAPLARPASRLTWPVERSEVVRREGETTIRTPDGPQTLESLLDDVETTYFQSRQEFVDDVEAVIGDGPVATS